MMRQPKHNLRAFNTHAHELTSGRELTVYRVRRDANSTWAQCIASLSLSPSVGDVYGYFNRAALEAACR